MSDSTDDVMETPAGWTRNGPTLVRTFKFKDFTRTMSFVNAVAHVANAADHHPDLLVSYGKCEVTLSTHDAGTVTPKDVVLAMSISKLPEF
ncbi:MAG: 4a-hydroxytetrahydrobiopterin dehydratase [Planctomycetota bacterium]